MPDDLGPTPEPRAEEPERFPGGVDAIEDEHKYGDIPDEPLSRDLHPDLNPATDDAPDALGEREDKPQAPEGEADDQETGEEDDPAAGQTAEDGSPEPPA